MSPAMNNNNNTQTRKKREKKSNIQRNGSVCEMSPMMIIHQNYTISLCVRRYKDSVCVWLCAVRRSTTTAPRTTKGCVTRSLAFCILNLADFCNINYNPISRHSICVVSMPIHALSLSVCVDCARSALCGMRMNTTLILLCLHCKQILCDYFRLFHCLLHRIDLFLFYSGRLTFR